MKLYNISLAVPVRVARRMLGEGISRTDFFDLYSLISADNEKHLAYGNPELSAEIHRRLKYEAEYVFRDQMDQLFCIIADRMIEEDPPERPWVDGPQEGGSTIPVYEKWGIPLEHRQDGTIKIDRDAIGDIPYGRRGQFLDYIVKFRQKQGTAQWFTATDGRWAKLALKYSELAKTGKTLDSIVRSIDRIYGFAHHGGMLADYFDERKWLEDALHIRSVGDPSQFMRYASSDVRDLLKTASHGSHPPDVNEIQKLRLAINKTMKGSGNAELVGNTVHISLSLYGFLSSYDATPSSDPNDPPWKKRSGRTYAVTVSDDPHYPGKMGEAYAAQPGGKTEPLGHKSATGVVSIGNTGVTIEIDGETLTGKDLGMYSSQENRPSQVAYKLVGAVRYSIVRQFKELSPPDALAI